MVTESQTSEGPGSPEGPSAGNSPAPASSPGPPGSPPEESTPAAAVIEVDEAQQEPVIDDGDSAVGSFQSPTVSVQDELIKQRREHGRKYQGYMEAKYLLPMDERELERLELQNHLVWMSLEQKLYHAPVTNLDRVLDVGCGTGQWTIEFADAHPESEVLGVDIAPVQPNCVPPNLKFEVDDLEMPWNFTTKFNYIHTEAMIGAIQDWPKYFRQSFEYLKPGGYLELHDVDFNIHCDDGTVPPDSHIVKWHAHLHEAADKMGFPLGIVHDFPDLMHAAGYTDITRRAFKWPSNTWPKDKKYKEIGWLACENFSWGCESMSLALMTRGLGWSVDEVRVFMAGLRRDLADTRMHAYWNFYAIYGRKPGGE